METNRIWIIACFKWLGIGNEPRKLFFTLLQAKLRRQSMHMLLLEDDSIIKDEMEIMEEVTR